MADGSDIIIKGGSAEIHFDHNHFAKDNDNPRKRRYEHCKITSIVISGSDGKDYSNSFPEGFKGTIKVSYE